MQVVSESTNVAPFIVF